MSPVSVPSGSLMLDVEQQLQDSSAIVKQQQQQQIFIPRVLLNQPSSNNNNLLGPVDSSSNYCSSVSEDRQRNSGSPYPNLAMQNRIMDLVHGKRGRSRRPPAMIDTSNTVDSTELLARQSHHLLRNQQRKDSISGVQDGLYGSLVGGYEESILTGRLSTPPSKPIPFICQIGVISMESKKCAVKCPPHIVIPFKASFYEWTDSASSTGLPSASRSAFVSGPTSAFSPISPINHAISSQDPFVRYRRRSSSDVMLSENDMDVDDGSTSSQSSQIPPINATHQPLTLISPSAMPLSKIGTMTDLLGTPYVGTVDLEWGLGAVNNYGYSLDYRIFTAMDCYEPVSLPGNRSMADPLGAMRIPLRGQVQVLVKNQNRTAVKVFLVPYDYRDMKPFFRTFLRQKSFSVASVLGSGKDIDAGAIPSETNASLRYALHLQFLCLPPSSNNDQSDGVDSTKNSRKLGKRLYLYKSIRVVFSHRVPDGSEKLKVIYETPEGRFECPPHLAPRSTVSTDDIITEPGFK